MTSRCFVLVVGLLVLLGMGLIDSAGLAQEPAEAPPETAAVAAPTPAPAVEEAVPEQEAPAEAAALIGMGFFPFLWLAIVAVVVSLLMYFLLQVRLMGGPAMNIGVGWIGAWLGSPVLGYWFEVLSAHGVYFIPAVLGCAGLVYGCYSWQRVAMQAPERPSPPEQPEQPDQSEQPDQPSQPGQGGPSVG